MAAGELFEDLRQYRVALTLAQRDHAVQTICYHAQIGIRYFYTIRETCAILHCSYDELHTVLHSFRLDAVIFLSIYRVPWYDLCAYLLEDQDDDMEEQLNEYLERISKRPTGIGRKTEVIDTGTNRPTAGSAINSITARNSLDSAYIATNSKSNGFKKNTTVCL